MVVLLPAFSFSQADFPFHLVRYAIGIYFLASYMLWLLECGLKRQTRRKPGRQFQSKQEHKPPSRTRQK
jgi:hypothetical protein